MKRIIFCLAILLSCHLAILLSCGGKGGKTLVTINGKAITTGDLDFLGTINPRIKMQIDSPFGKKQILDNLVEQELLYQAATRKGIQRSSDVQAKIDLYKKVIISQSYVEAEIEKKAKEYYEKNKGEFEKLQLAHIEIKYADAKDEKKDPKAHPKKPEKDKVTRTRAAALELANKIKTRIDAGEDFATVAKEASEDAISKNNGGDLGLASKGEPRLERRGWGPLLEKAFTMQVGEKAGPIETKDGYHIITVTKGVEPQLFDEAKQAIIFKIQGDERTKLLADLKKNSKVVFAEEKKPAEQKPAEGQLPAATEPSAVPAPAAAPVAPTAPAPASTAPPASK